MPQFNGKIITYLLQEMKKVNLREEFQKAINTGIPISVIAKKINKDPSTLNKWLHGTRNISKEIEQNIYSVLIDIKEQWKNILL